MDKLIEHFLLPFVLGYTFSSIYERIIVKYDPSDEAKFIRAIIVGLPLYLLSKYSLYFIFPSFYSLDQCEPEVLLGKDLFYCLIIGQILFSVFLGYVCLFFLRFWRAIWDTFYFLRFKKFKIAQAQAQYLLKVRARFAEAYREKNPYKQFWKILIAPMSSFHESLKLSFRAHRFLKVANDGLEVLATDILFNKVQASIMIELKNGKFYIGALAIFDMIAESKNSKKYLAIIPSRGGFRDSNGNVHFNQNYYVGPVLIKEPILVAQDDIWTMRIYNEELANKFNPPLPNQSLGIKVP